MKRVFERRYQHAEKIILVADNLNTHSKASFYEAFQPTIAMELAKRYEFHYTPVHGSWLNIAECELSAMSVECLGNRRIDNIESLNEELFAWQTNRNLRQRGVNWQFTAEDARTKLKRLYPTPLF